MKIALIHYRLGLKGGLETRLLNYANWLVKAGHEVWIIYARDKGRAPLSPEIKFQQLQVGWAPRPLRRVVFANMVKRYLAHHSFDFSLSLGRTRGQDVVLAAANHRGYLQAMGKKGNRLTDWAQDWCDQRAFTETPHILAASHFMKAELESLYHIPAANIEVLPPPVSVDQFSSLLKANQQEYKLQWGMDPAKISCLLVSTSHHRKGLDILLAAFAKLSPEQFELFVAGDPVKSQLPHVHGLGFVPEPSKLYAAADIYLHPARFEPFGQVISEALQSGTPVYVSSKVGAQDLVSPEVGKVIDSLSPAVWAEHIQAYDPADFSIPASYLNLLGLGVDDHMKQILARISDEYTR